MKRVAVLVIVVLVVGGAAVAGWYYIREHPEWWFWLQDEFNSALDELGLTQTETPDGLSVSGFIEADEAAVSTELGGRILALHADEGDEIEEGQLLVELDDALLRAQIAIAEADLDVAEARLVQVQAGVREETLDHAKAMLLQSQVAQEAALTAWEDARAMLDNPQELELAVTAARAQLGLLDLQERQAEALANAAQAGRDLADEVVALLQDIEPRREWVPIETPTGTVRVPVRIAVPVDVMDSARQQQATATYQSWMAWTGLEQAQAARDGAESYLEQLLRQESAPLTLQAQANAAKAQYEIATATVGLAQAQVDGLQMGATPSQIAMVAAQVDIARASLEALQVQADRFRLRAPLSGLILERPVHVGEVALPGAPLMTLGDLENVTLTVYVPEDQLGKVRVGQSVSVTVDAYPGREFSGRVTFIASEAEFTPKNVQTREERVSMVFAVKVSLPNPDHALKPGMPADAVLVPIVEGSE